jgi:hypothetical protein
MALVVVGGVEGGLATLVLVESLTRVDVPISMLPFPAIIGSYFRLNISLDADSQNLSQNDFVSLQKHILNIFNNPPTAPVLTLQQVGHSWAKFSAFLGSTTASLYGLDIHLNGRKTSTLPLAIDSTIFIVIHGLVDDTVNRLTIEIRTSAGRLKGIPEEIEFRTLSRINLESVAIYGQLEGVQMEPMKMVQDLDLATHVLEGTNGDTKGIPIVSMEWIKASLKAGQVLDEKLA